MNLPEIETVAKSVHDAWVQTKRAQGITTRKSETGEELMVEYDELSEEAKELDRNSVRAVYAAIESLTKEKRA
jgi:molybdenum-dependent DNA-binding transcriptional regulator ModE